MAQPRKPPSHYMRKYGVPEWLGNALIGQESGGSDTVRSTKNALGRMQIHLPSHPDVSPQEAQDPDFAMDYGFRLLSGHYKKFGTWPLALAAYNAGVGAVEKYGGVPPYRETLNYVKSIMGRRPKGGATVQASPSVAPTMSSSSGGAQAALEAPPTRDFSGAAKRGLASLASGQYDPTAALSDLAASVPSTPAQQDEIATPLAPAGALPATQGRGPGAGSSDWSKWVIRPAPRQGPSQPHGEEILSFVGRIGRRGRIKLTPWANESHSLTTVNGTPSAHGSGRAADIPATGSRLRHLGYLALLEAGMSKKDARAAARKGGLYNVGGYQIIFSTDIGGNHHDHLHVGIRG